MECGLGAVTMELGAASDEGLTQVAGATWHLSWVGRLGLLRRCHPVFFLPLLALAVGCVVPQPTLHIVLLQAMPVKIVTMVRDTLLVRGKNVSRNETVELAVAEVVSQIEDDTLLIQSRNRLP